MTEFTDLSLEPALLDALRSAGYTQPTPIQAMAIKPVLDGRDLLGIAATGTGKTAAFALPILQRLAKGARAARGTCRALILAPTRELAAQIAESFETYGANLKLTVTVVVGGVAQRPQQAALARGVDILVATPGRLLDHMGTRAVRLDDAHVLVLDEADHMLDLGFIPAVRRIVGRMPKDRQTLLFSATMPREIRALADDFLRDPETVSATPPATLAERIDQHVVHVDQARKASLLAKLLREADHDRALVFTRTKRGADRVAKSLGQAGIPAAAIHGNKSQGQRERALAGFRDGSSPVMVATDIAARGIDVDGIRLVVNYDLPHVPETYVHRIGRTARAGASGKAIAFCAPDERSLLKAIESLIRARIPVSGGGDPADLPAERPADHRPKPHRPEAQRQGAHRQGAQRQGAHGQEPRRQDGRRQDERRAQPKNGAKPKRQAAGPGSDNAAKARHGKPKHAAPRPGPRHDGPAPRGDAGPRIEDMPFMRA